MWRCVWSLELFAICFLLSVRAHVKSIEKPASSSGSDEKEDEGPTSLEKKLEDNDKGKPSANSGLAVVAGNKAYYQTLCASPSIRLGR